MTALLKAELVKLRTTRTFAALAGAAIGLSLLLTVLAATLGEPTDESVLTDVFAGDLSSLFILLLALIGITGEWRHRTITSSLLAAPDRLRFLGAKVLAFACAGLVLSIVISIAIAIVAYILLAAQDLPTPALGDVLEQAARGALVAALLGGLGVALGGLVRNQVVAVVGVLVILFVVEPAVIALAPEVGRFGPLIALPTAAAGMSPDDSGLGDVDLLASGAALFCMLAWIGALFALGAALLRGRDLS